MMEHVSLFDDDPQQPKITLSKSGKAKKFIWPGAEGDKRKAVPGDFVTEKYLTPTTFPSTDNCF